MFMHFFILYFVLPLPEVSIGLVKILYFSHTSDLHVLGIEDSKECVFINIYLSVSDTNFWALYFKNHWTELKKKYVRLFPGINWSLLIFGVNRTICVAAILCSYDFLNSCFSRTIVRIFIKNHIKFVLGMYSCCLCFDTNQQASGVALLHFPRYSQYLYPKNYSTNFRQTSGVPR